MPEKQLTDGLALPVDDPVKQTSTTETKQKDYEEQVDKARQPRDDAPEDDVDMTEEDRALKEKLDLLVVRVLAPTTDAASTALLLAALDALKKEIRESTSSMTSVPKPLKFLGRHYSDLVIHHRRRLVQGSAPQQTLADILSVLSMTSSAQAVAAAAASTAAALAKKQKERKDNAERGKGNGKGKAATEAADKAAAEALKKAKEAAQAAKAATADDPLAAFPALMFKLQGSSESCGVWGHEYVRHLSGEIGAEFQRRQVVAVEEKQDISSAEQLLGNMMPLVGDILPWYFGHNAEVDGIDLVLDIELLGRVRTLITEDNVTPVCKYLLACATYLADPDEQAEVFDIVYQAYVKYANFPAAVRIALRLHDREKLLQCLELTQQKDPVMRKQLAFIIASSSMRLEEFEDDEELSEIVGNTKLSEYYTVLARELDVQDAKSPDDVYKRHLEEGGSSRPLFGDAAAAATGPSVDSAKENCASSIANAFINCGFGQDTLVMPEGADWVHKNKPQYKMTAAASLGMISLWDVENGFTAIDKYSFSNESTIKAGALLATGILSCGVSSEMDASFALLSEHLEGGGGTPEERIAAIFGLGLAYAGTGMDDVLELLVPLIVDDTQSMEVVAVTCLSLGLVFVGTANEDVSSSIIEAFLDRSETDLKDSSVRLMCLGVGLLFLGKGESAEGALNAIQVVERPVRRYLELTIRTCAWAGSGSVVEIQELLDVIAVHIDVDTESEEKKEDEEEAAEDEEKKEEVDTTFDGTKGPLKGWHQEVAVLGLAMVAVGEPLARQMALRTLDHLLQYGEVNIKRVVPFAYSLISISNPDLVVSDSLSKLTHDSDQCVSQNAILALGFIGAGTNNSRIATQLRALAGFYANEPDHLFLVRIAQGMLHFGKGLVTLEPVHTGSGQMHKVAMAGLLSVFHSAFDLKHSVLKDRHYMMYALCCTVRPRFLLTVDEELNHVAVSVRVGQAVDTVGQPGKPREITGFQTHTTPVLLAHGEKAQLASEEFIALTDVLEGVVIVKKNPDAKTDE